MSSPTASAPTLTDGPLRQALRAELETTRQAFYALLAALTPEDWQRPSLNPAWTTGEILTHITGYLFIIPSQLVLLQTRTFPDLTQESADALNDDNVRQTREDAQAQSLSSIAQTYETAHAATLAALVTVRNDEWQLGAQMPDMGPTFSGEYRTIEGLFRYHARHFAEHVAQVPGVAVPR